MCRVYASRHREPRRLAKAEMMVTAFDNEHTYTGRERIGCQNERVQFLPNSSDEFQQCETIRWCRR